MFVACTYNVLKDHCNLFRLWARGSWVLDANVGGKLIVTPGLVLLLHLIERSVDERISRLKHPATLGAAEALKVILLDPYQLARHGRSICLTVYKTEQCPEAGTC
jgi:hypothetical protein